jgi:hypothetical protein
MYSVFTREIFEKVKFRTLYSLVSLFSLQTSRSAFYLFEQSQKRKTVFRQIISGWCDLARKLDKDLQSHGVGEVELGNTFIEIPCVLVLVEAFSSWNESPFDL